MTLNDTHWEHFLTRARLIGWVESRGLGLTVEQNGRIVDAVITEIRRSIERREPREIEQSPPASLPPTGVDPAAEPGSEAPRSASERTQPVNPDRGWPEGWVVGVSVLVTSW